MQVNAVLYPEQQYAKSSQRSALLRWLPAGLICCLSAATGSANAQVVLPGPGIISTVAGSNFHGYSGDGGPAQCMTPK
jgi:hypothetical protein